MVTSSATPPFRLWPFAVFRRKLSWQHQVFKSWRNISPKSLGWGRRAREGKTDKHPPLLPLSSIALVVYVTWSWRSPNGPCGDVSVASGERRREAQLGPIDVWSSRLTIFFLPPLIGSSVEAHSPSLVRSVTHLLPRTPTHSLSCSLARSFTHFPLH